MRAFLGGLTLGLIVCSAVPVSAFGPTLVTFDAAGCPGPGTTEFRAVGANGHTVIAATPLTAGLVTVPMDLLAQRYTVVATTLSGGQTFRVGQSIMGLGDPVPVEPTPTVTPTSTVTPTPSPGQQSPDCTKATTVTMADGVWSVGPQGEVLRNGVWAAPGTIQGYKVVAAKLYLFGSDSKWYLFGDNTALAGEPVCQAQPSPTPSPTPTPSPDLTQIAAQLKQAIADGFALIAPKPLVTCDLKIVSVQSPLASGEYRFTGGYSQGCLVPPVKGAIFKVVK